MKHPLFRAFQGRGAERMESVALEPLGKFVKAIEPQEKVAEAKIEITGAEALIEFPFSMRIELVQADADMLSDGVAPFRKA